MASSTAGSTCCATLIRKRRGASSPNPFGRHGARPSTRSSSIRPGAWRWSRPAPAITSGPPPARCSRTSPPPALITSIETVLLTHMHPDHSAGLSDPATGRRNFSNAELVVHENEPRHWFDDAAMAKASERQQRLYFLCAREQITPYKDRTRLFQKGEVFPGVTAIP